MPFIKKRPEKKAPPERDIEREIRYRKSKNTLKGYIAKLEHLQRMVLEHGKEAAKLGDPKLLRRQATKYLEIQERLKKGKRMLLMMEEAKLQRDMVKTSQEFIAFAKDISEAIAEGPDAERIASMQQEFEKAMERAEDLDTALATAIDVTSEGVLSKEGLDEDAVKSLEKAMEGEAETEEKELDEKISKSIREVERMMKEG